MVGAGHRLGHELVERDLRANRVEVEHRVDRESGERTVTPDRERERGLGLPRDERGADDHGGERADDRSRKSPCARPRTPREMGEQHRDDGDRGRLEHLGIERSEARREHVVPDRVDRGDRDDGAGHRELGRRDHRGVAACTPAPIDPADDRGEATRERPRQHDHQRHRHDRDGGLRERGRADLEGGPLRDQPRGLPHEPREAGRAAQDRDEPTGEPRGAATFLDQTQRARCPRGPQPAGDHAEREQHRQCNQGEKPGRGDHAEHGVHATALEGACEDRREARGDRTRCEPPRADDPEVARAGKEATSWLQSAD